MRARGTALVVLVLALLAGCGSDGRPPAPSATRTPLPLAAASAPFELVVTNQSFDDATVRIRVSVDGAPVVDEDFEVGGQHVFVSFPLVLPPGAHTVTAETDSGARISRTVTLTAGTPRYAVIAYWKAADEPKRLDWREADEPFAFA